MQTRGDESSELLQNPQEKSLQGVRRGFDQEICFGWTEIATTIRWAQTFEDIKLQVKVLRHYCRSGPILQGTEKPRFIGREVAGFTANDQQLSQSADIFK